MTTALTGQKWQYSILCGDFNAKMGTKQDTAEAALGNFRLPGRNERGEVMLEYLLQEKIK